ncbi:DNA repair protein RecO [Acetobacteraceae bacterium]|nr:DNA repair protein RecO [Acetobacteraceae bacterium]
MKEWTSLALILTLRPYGERGAIVSFFTQDYGLKYSFAYGVFSKKNRSLWQKGNLVQLHWKTHLRSNLGTASIEVVRNYTAPIYDRALVLALISSLSVLLNLSMPEEDPLPNLFSETLDFLELTASACDLVLLEKYILWEKNLLAYMGFGLSLSSCILSGRKDNLLYVSPKTGAAVAAGEAEEWKKRLFHLPKIMGGSWQELDPLSIEWGLALTGHFLEKIFIEMRHSELPLERKFLLKTFEEVKDNLSN